MTMIVVMIMEIVVNKINCSHNDNVNVLMMMIIMVIIIMMIVSNIIMTMT